MTSQPPTLTDRFRSELKRLLASGWSERDLAEGIGKSSQGKLQGWLRPKGPTRPPMDALEQLAGALGTTVPKLAAELYGETAPGSDRTWPDVAKEIHANESARAALMEGLEDSELVDLATDLLREAKRRREASASARGFALLMTASSMVASGLVACDAAILPEAGKIMLPLDTIVSVGLN
jgi:transcriptional regulator with XRE-family HTH domain